MSDIPDSSGDGLPVRVVFEWYLRRLTADRFANRNSVSVPEPLSGWVVAAEGDAAEEDGLRPMGALRELLAGVVSRAGLDAQQRVVVRSMYGLSDYPSVDAVRPIQRRIRRQRGQGPLGERRLREIAQESMDLIEETAMQAPLPSAGRKVVAGPVAEPSTAPWFLIHAATDSERLRLIGLAVDAARTFVATTGVDGSAGTVLAEIEAYFDRLLDGDWPPARPIGRSRARAVVGVALWEVTRRDEVRAALAGFDPASSGIREPPSGFGIGDVAVGAFLAGDRTDEVVRVVCAAATTQASQDRVVANVVADLLLGALGPGENRRMSGEAEANVLRTALRIRSTDEDPTVIGLAHAALIGHRDRWQTIDALQAAVKVASAYGRWAVAEHLCDRVDAILADHPLLPRGRHLEVERIEYGLWTLHQRSATLRRRVDSGGSLVHLGAGIRAADEAERMLDHNLRLLDAGAPGDGSIRWRHDLSVRRAELHLLAADRLSGRDRDGHRRAADNATATAVGIAVAFGLAGDLLVPLTKVRLQAALLDGEWEQAAVLLRQLHDRGWPLRRTLPEIFDLVEQPSRSPCFSPLLLEAVEEIAVSERAGGWTPAASDAARRRQGRPRRS